jgi:hypothetical protein
MLRSLKKLQHRAPRQRWSKVLWRPGAPGLDAFLRHRSLDDREGCHPGAVLPPVVRERSPVDDRFDSRILQFEKRLVEGRRSQPFKDGRFGMFSSQSVSDR